MRYDVTLRPLLPHDYRHLYDLVQQPGVGEHWRFPSGVPPFEAFVEGLWQGVLLQTVIGGDGDDFVGLVSVYNANFRNGTCEVALMQRPGVAVPGLALLGMGKVLVGLFANWPFRYVIVETYDFSLLSFRSAMSKFAHHCGTLKDDRYLDGRYHDKYIFIIRHDFLKDAPEVTLRLLGEAGGVMQPRTGRKEAQ